MELTKDDIENLKELIADYGAVVSNYNHELQLDGWSEWPVDPSLEKVKDIIERFEGQ